MLRKLSKVAEGTKPAKKHPDVIAFEKWEASEEGNRCFTGVGGWTVLEDSTLVRILGGPGQRYIGRGRRMTWPEAITIICAIAGFVKLIYIIAKYAQ